MNSPTTKTTTTAVRRIKVDGRGPAHPRPSTIRVTVRPAPTGFVRPKGLKPICRVIIAPAHADR